MRQICNLAYATLTEGRSAPEIAQIDMMLGPPENKEKMVEKQNEESMRQLSGMLGGGLLVVPPRKPRPKDGEKT